MRAKVIKKKNNSLQIPFRLTGQVWFLVAAEVKAGNYVILLITSVFLMRRCIVAVFYFSLFFGFACSTRMAKTIKFANRVNAKFCCCFLFCPTKAFSVEILEINLNSCCLLVVASKEKNENKSETKRTHSHKEQRIKIRVQINTFERKMKTCINKKKIIII